MYARPNRRPTQRKSEPRRFPAPVGGWISNRSLATPNDGATPGAAILDNFFPRATGVILRRGTRRYATVGSGERPTTSLFSYNTGAVRKLFATTDEAIYDVTAVTFPYDAAIVDEEDNVIVTENGDFFGWSSVGPSVMGGFTGGNWIVVQFSTTGGIYLIGVNGQDTGFIYDGSDFWPNLPGGLWSLPYDGQVTPFVEGDTVTGSTSSAAGVIWRVEAGRLILRDVEYPPETWTIEYVGGSAAFHVESTLRGQVSSASARIASITPGTTTWTLPYDGGTVDFTPAQIVTGTTSGASGEVVSVAGTTASGTLTIKTLSGTFQDNETITGSGGGAAVVNGKASDPILAGTLTLEGLIGDFIAGEPLRDGSGGAANAVGAQTFVSGGSFVDGETITGSMGGEAVTAGTAESVAPGVTFPDGLTSADMSYVWPYKNRLWFLQKDSLNAWYMDQVDAIGGGATMFPLSGVMGRGGALMFGQGWSLETSAEGGLSEQCVFVSEEGEAAVYQGSYPGEAATWTKVGVYRIGRPLGNRSFIKGGGDIAVATSVGLVPLSKAIELDVTSLNVATVSYRIQDAWNDATLLRSAAGWQAELWPEQKMAVIAPPTTQDAPNPVLFISNTETGAWTRFTGWRVTCMEVFEGKLYYGGPDGRVMLANVGGDDEGAPYTGVVLPLYDDFDNPGALKISTAGRAVVRGTNHIYGQLNFQSDYLLTVPTAPPPSITSGPANIWGSAIWGQSVWGGGLADVVTTDWVSLGGTGYACSLAYQVTSGDVQPLDVEVVRLEMLYSAAEQVS
ncbi:hypothetical protein LZK98_11895 [Sphingomonas cannabina]|uniref:hypothetical protein n=1 Tax=Sphingomonas cannabina TaxID=2899123 RepID=UPI001F222A06|nr:hypothetical protein [Sphingomonas cannabina]UIJ43794.1 hypothetical protein LZK98_11895 [Sphingomonas cannabina]